MSLGSVGVGRGEDRADLLQADAVLVQRGWIQLDAHAGKGAAADAHLPHALNLGQFLRHDGGRGVVHLALAQHVGGERDHEDGRIGRIHLAVIGVVGEIGRQVAAGGGDGRLHVARRGVDVAVQIELQGDAARSERARRRHLGDGGDAAELALQRSGHRRRHGLRTGARQAGAYRDGGKVHLRQGRYRENAECHRAGQRDGDGEKRGGDRPVDERSGNIHGITPREQAPCRDSDAWRREKRRASRSKNR